MNGVFYAVRAEILFRFVRESVKRKLIVDTEESRQATN
jgi:hypothetical protein